MILKEFSLRALKRSSLQKRICKFTPKKFYKIYPWSFIFLKCWVTCTNRKNCSKLARTYLKKIWTSLEIISGRITILRCLNHLSIFSCLRFHDNEPFRRKTLSKMTSSIIGLVTALIIILLNKYYSQQNVLLSFPFLCEMSHFYYYAICQYDERWFAEWHYAECRHGDCRGAMWIPTPRCCFT